MGGNAPFRWSRRKTVGASKTVHINGLELAGASDPVAGLVLSAPHRVDRLYVGGDEIVRDGRLVRADEDEIAREQRTQARRFAG